MTKALQHRGSCSGFCVRIATATLLSVALTPAVHAQTFGVLYTFQGSTDGAQPVASLMRDSVGNLYGTNFGDQNTSGTVFKVTPTGQETTLWTFGSRRYDGQGATAALICDSKGNLYSTTRGGGRYGGGTVFRLKKSGVEKVLYSFSDKGTGGFVPQAAVIADSMGNFYGTTAEGGDFGFGTVFKLDAAGNATVLYSFTGGKDGGSPAASLVFDAAGSLYGTTASGGSTQCVRGCGVVFKLEASGKETVLHSFIGAPDGVNPVANLVRDAAGDLYGTTVGGGSHNSGIVFKLAPTGKETVLHDFAGSPDGALPEAGLIRDAKGNLYGTTNAGGDSNCAINAGPGCGIVFRLDKQGEETVLYSFTGAADGGFPVAALVRDGSGNLYGTTELGGKTGCGVMNQGCGVVFKITP
jgi:uncharacterized repeat protein (TIGR03803 family)